MKKLILAAFATLSFNAFSQSYMVMENGTVITLDKSGYIYDFGHYAFPNKITQKGGRWFVEENNVLATVDEYGGLFRKYEAISEAVVGSGANYFLSDKNSLYAFDARGNLSLTNRPELQGAKQFGGHYLAVPSQDNQELANLWAINLDGNLVRVEGEPVELKRIMVWGGNYIMNNRGLVTTISGNGVAKAWPEVRVGIIGKKGGNYFTDSSNTIFTVAEDGSIKVPAIPVTLKIPQITKLGSNYFLDLNGRLFVVDPKGDVYERTMKDVDFRHARVLSL